MSEPVRRQIEQPTEESQKRSGCLLWGAVLGVLVGIMLGIYALPPILKHYYGETEVAAGEAFEGSGKTIRLLRVARVGDAGGGPAPWMPTQDFHATLAIIVEDPWAADRTDFSLEFDGIDEWQVAEPGEPLLFEPGAETEVELHFIVEAPTDGDGFAVRALHLSDPRVKFEID